MNHEFVAWPGFQAREDYCRLCDQDKSKASLFCSGREEESGEPSPSEERYLYSLHHVTCLLGEDKVCSDISGSFISLSSEDSTTLIRFKEEIRPSGKWKGTVSSARNWIPASLYKFCAQEDYEGKEFRFVRIRESWIQDGLDCDDDCTIIDDTPKANLSPATIAAAQQAVSTTWPTSSGPNTTPPTPITFGSIPRVRPYNTDARDSAGEEHGEASEEGLGSIPYTLAYRNQLLTSLYEDGVISKRMLQSALLSDNVRQDTGMSEET